jgi:hypothetical protein
MGRTCSIQADMRNSYKIFIREPQEKGYMGGVDIDRRIISKCSLRNRV